MLGLRRLTGPIIHKSGLPAARKVGRLCFGMAVRVACLPYTGPVACVSRVNRTAVSVAELGLDLVCGFVPEVLLAGGVRNFTPQFQRSSGAGHHHKLNLACVQGDVLADLSQADLEEAYSQADINFSVSKLVLDELRHQVSCDICQQDTQVSKQLPGSCSQAARPIPDIDTDCIRQCPQG